MGNIKTRELIKKFFIRAKTYITALTKGLIDIIYQEATANYLRITQLIITCIRFLIKYQIIPEAD